MSLCVLVGIEGGGGVNLESKGEGWNWDHCLVLSLCGYQLTYRIGDH